HQCRQEKEEVPAWSARSKRDSALPEFDRVAGTQGKLSAPRERNRWRRRRQSGRAIAVSVDCRHRPSICGGGILGRSVRGHQPMRRTRAARHHPAEGHAPGAATARRGVAS
ncbi:unnamed protein product, partial [Ectocarpus sp. 4 AP-2014]